MTVPGKSAKVAHRASQLAQSQFDPFQVAERAFLLDLSTVVVDRRTRAGRNRKFQDLSIVDRRTRAWRLRKQHRAELVAALGGEERLSAHQLLQLDIVLGLTVLVVDFQARLAAGEQLDVERFISASKELRRVTAELKLPQTRANAATLRDRANNGELRDHIAKRAAARAGAVE